MADFEALGYIRNPYDKCIMTLPSQTPGRTTVEGIVLIEVDDILEGGTAEHRARMDLFYKKYQCGKRKCIQELRSEGTLISGARVIQRKDFSFVWHMEEYVEKTLQSIDYPRGLLSNTKELDDAHLAAVVSCNGKIGWLSSNGRPDLAAGHSIIAGEYKHKLPSLITSCNACVKQAKTNRVEHHAWSIPPDDLRLVAWCDSSFDPKGERHQQGWIIGFTNRSLNNSDRAPVSIATWRSRKLPRKAGSPQLVETYAASSASAEASWIRCLLQSTLFSDFDIFTQWPRHLGVPTRQPTVLRTDRAEVKDPYVTIISDSKGLYDALNNELPQDDKKSAVEVPIIEQILLRMKGRCRWTPRNYNPADALTKLKGAHMAPMMDLLKTGFYHLKVEAVHLEARAAEKASTGHVSRQKRLHGG